MPGVQDAAEELLSKLYNEGQANVEDLGNTATGASAVISVSDPSVASTTTMVLHGATPVITLPAPRKGAKKRLVVIQDGTGSRVPSWASASGAVKWVGAAAPTLQTGANAVDIVDFMSYDGVNWVGDAKLHVA